MLAPEPKCGSAMGPTVCEYPHSQREFAVSNGRLSDPAATSLPRLKVGLALSAGAARGLAHIGVIQVFEENGIRIDAVAGCSMGAYIGALWCAGCDGAELERLAREIEGRWGFLKLINLSCPPRRAFLRNQTIRERLMQSIGTATFESLQKPLCVVATDLDQLNAAYFDRGEVACAVQASCAIPGILEPVQIGRSTYTDGGITDPLPARVLRRMGCQIVIAVDVIPPSQFQTCVCEHEREQADIKKPNRAISWLNQHLNPFGRGNLFDTLYRSLTAAQMLLAEHAGSEADFVIRPISCDASWHEFHLPAKYISLGRRVAGENLGQIRSLLARKEVRHETHMVRVA